MSPDKGTSINGIAREVGVAYGTAWNYVEAMES
jgi:molybdate transport repressor ModE-like protein